jgi:uncharacterized repeat protein (TIGR02543 family)
MKKRGIAALLALCMTVSCFTMTIGAIEKNTEATIDESLSLISTDITRNQSGQTAEDPIPVPAEELAFSGGTIYGIDADWFLSQLPQGETTGHLYLSVDIPAAIQGQKVTTLGSDAFSSGWSNDKEKYNAINSHDYPGCSFTVVDADFSGATNLTTLASQAMLGCKNLTGVLDLSNTQISTIGQMGLSGCTNLTGVILPDTLKEIGNSAFLNDTSLRFVTTKDQYDSSDPDFVDFSLPDGLVSIGARAFAVAFADVALTVVIPESVTTIGSEAFYAQWNTSTLDYLPVRTIIVKGTNVDGFDAKAFKFYDSGLGNYPPRVTVMPNKETYDAFMKKAGGFSQDKDGITYPVTVSFYDKETASGSAYTTQEKLYKQSMRYVKQGELWSYDQSYALPTVPGGPAQPGYTDSVWQMDGKTLTEDTKVTSTVVTMTGGKLAAPEVEFEVTHYYRYSSGSNSSWTETVKSGDTVTLDITKESYMNIVPTREHPLAGTNKGDIFFWYKWYDTTGARNGEEDFNFGETINILRIDAENEARTDTNYYQLDLEGKYVGTSGRPSYGWDGSAIYTSQAKDFYIYVDVVRSPENLAYVDAEDYEYYMENVSKYWLRDLYATPEELIQNYLMKYFDETGISSDSNAYEYVALEWKLKDGTTYSAEPGAENQFTWTVSAEDFADLGWTNTNQIPLTGDVTLQNPFAITFMADGTLVKEFYVHKGEGLTADQFPQVPEKKGYTGTWSATGDITNVTANQTIQAVYTPISYTISYEMDGGTNPAENPTSYTAEQDIVLKDPSKSGYQFTGWTYEGQTTPQKNLTLPAGSVSGNLTFTAHWEKNPVVTQSYALHYETNGGEDLPHESQTSHWVKAYEELPVPEKTGYLFAGWHEDEELTKLVEDDVIVNRTKITLYAKWEKDEGHPEHTGVSDVLNTEDHMAYLEGYPGSKFMPEGQMTRAEVAQMFYNLLLDKQVETTVTFEDVADNAWYADAIHALASMGILEGREGNKFDPDTPITRAEFATIAVRFASQKPEGEVFFQDVSKDAWYYSYVTQCAAFGWIEGYEDDTFRPDENIRRGEAATIVNRMLGRQADEEYIDSHSQELASFVDLSQDHWAYYHIMEATNSHDYEKKNGQESWIGLKD